jgi:hypothetical protein
MKKKFQTDQRVQALVRQVFAVTKDILVIVMLLLAIAEKLQLL